MTFIIEDIFSEGGISGSTIYGKGDGITTMPASVDRHVTGFTYNGNNQFSINSNYGETTGDTGDFSTIINEMSGLTVNGILSGDTLEGNIANIDTISTNILSALTISATTLVLSGLDPGDSSFKSDGEMYMVNNAVATAVAVASTPVQISGVTTAGNFNDFSHIPSPPRLTYTGDTIQNFHITITTTAEQDGGGNSLVLFFVRKNGITQSNLEIQQQYASSRQALAINGILSLSKNDYLELWLQNDTAAKDILVTHMNFTVVQI